MIEAIFTEAATRPYDLVAGEFDSSALGAKPMTRPLCLWILSALLLACLAITTPATAQEDGCNFDLTEVNALLAQAQTAYAADDLITALDYVDQAQAVLAALEADCLAAGGPQLLRLALLTPDDLPSGWLVQSEPTTLSAPPATLFCATIEATFQTRGVQVSYINNTAPLGLVEAIYYFPNEDAAEYFALAQSAAQSCYGVEWQQLYAGETTINATLASLPITVLGDESFGAVLTNTGLPDVNTLQTDTLYIRHGSYIIAVAFYLAGDGELDDVQALALAQLALQKLTQFEDATLTSTAVDNAELFLVALGMGDRETAADLVCESARDSLDDLFGLFESQAGDGTFTLTDIACQVDDNQRISCAFTVEITHDAQTQRHPQNITFLLDNTGKICGSE